MHRAGWRLIEPWGSSPTVREGFARAEPLAIARIFATRTIVDKLTRTLPASGSVPTTNISIDETALVFYYLLNTGKEVIEKFMSSNHSEVAET